MDPAWHQIDISLSSVVQNVTMDFATAGGVPFTLTAFLGGNLVGSTAKTGSLGKYHEGVISFDSPFDSLTLTTPDNAISIDHVDFNATTPEPALALPLAGLVAVIAVPLRRRRQVAAH